MKKDLFKKAYVTLTTIFYFAWCIQLFAQNPPTPTPTTNPIPSNPYPPGLPSPVPPVPPPGLKTDTMSIPRPAKVLSRDTIKSSPNEMTPDTGFTPVPKQNK